MKRGYVARLARGIAAAYPRTLERSLCRACGEYATEEAYGIPRPLFQGMIYCRICNDNARYAMNGLE